MRLTHNLASLNIYRQQTMVEKKQSIAMARISSGIKINKASDGPNQLAQSERMRMQIRGMQMAQRNSQDGVSMLQVAEGSLDSVTSMLQRIRELSVQAGGTTADSDKVTIQSEIGQLINGINDNVNNTEFNGVKLLNEASVTDNTSPVNLQMSVGANDGESAKIPMYNLTSNNVGDMSDPLNKKTLDMIDITKPGGIDEALKIADGALGTIVSVRSQYGALENRFSSSYDNSVAISDSTQGAESSIRDADIAKEMIDFSSSNILVEAGNALMAQTNRFPQEILKILDNIRS